jgi:tRNA U34 5-methylaminomethyl-2-thiouridine-forming methyltransferase MnmC
VSKHSVIITADGSGTLYSEKLNDHFHSVNGAITESRHVFIKNGYLNKTDSGHLTVFEVGFGTGLNCLLTALAAAEYCQEISYYTIEKYPLPDDILMTLNYGQFFGSEGLMLYDRICRSPWDKITLVNPMFELCKIKADFLVTPVPVSPDLIYFDAFGPDKQPEMWTSDMFKKLCEAASPNACIVTYSAKGEVRRQLAAAGFFMERLPGPPGKREMLRGIKK